MRFNQTGQFVVALGDVALHPRFGQHHAAQGGETAVDVHSLVEPLVGVVVLVPELLAPGQVHECDGTLDCLLVAGHDLVELRIGRFNECDVNGENGMRARTIDIGVVGRGLALLEAPVEHCVQISNIVHRDLVHVAHR